MPCSRGRVNETREYQCSAIIVEAKVATVVAIVVVVVADKKGTVFCLDSNIMYLEFFVFFIRFCR